MVTALVGVAPIHTASNWQAKAVLSHTAERKGFPWGATRDTILDSVAPDAALAAATDAAVVYRSEYAMIQAIHHSNGEETLVLFVGGVVWLFLGPPEEKRRRQWDGVMSSLPADQVPVMPEGQIWAHVSRWKRSRH